MMLHDLMPPLALFDNFTPWWEGLGAARQVFYSIGFVAGLLALILAVLNFIGLEHHDAAGALDGSIDDGGGGIFSVKPLTGFFLGFGWVGGMALDAGWSLFAAIASGLAAGGLMMSLIVMMFRAFLAMRSDGTMRIQEAVGAVGTVYITLPPSKASGGQVTVNFSGRQETFAALNASDRSISSGEKIKVLEIIDGRTVLVAPLA